MSRRVLSGTALAVALTGCAALQPAEVVRTEVVHIGCPTDPPPVAAYTPPAKPIDMRVWYDAYDQVVAGIEGDRVIALAYRETWELCPRE